MKNKTVLITAVLTVILFLAACGTNEKDELARRLAEIEEVPAVDETGESVTEYDRERLAELKRDVEKWSDELNRTLEASQNVAYYYKLLGLKYMDFKSYKLAFESFEKAIEIQPENAVLHYRAGLSAARMKLSTPQEADQQMWLEKASFYYRRAVELSPDYTEALYALSLLCFYELNLPLDAERYADQLLRTSPHHPRGLFLRANIHLAAGENEEAVACYDTIIETAKGDEYIEKAKENRQAVLEGWGRE